MIQPKKGEKAEEGVDTTLFTSEESILPQSKWCEVSAIRSDRRIELKPLLNKEKAFPIGDKSDLAALLRLPSLEEQALKLKLRPPSVDEP